MSLNNIRQRFSYLTAILLRETLSSPSFSKLREKKEIRLPNHIEFQVEIWKFEPKKAAINMFEIICTRVLKQPTKLNKHENIGVTQQTGGLRFGN